LGLLLGFHSAAAVSLKNLNFQRKAEMPRVRRGAARHQAKKRIFKAVKGHRGSAGRLYRLAKEANVRAAVNARVGRKLRKRDFRGLWITRLSRKMLSEIAIADPKGFDAIVEAAKIKVKS
jgi:large subunit ribosomal protein L20